MRAACRPSEGSLRAAVGLIAWLVVLGLAGEVVAAATTSSEWRRRATDAFRRGEIDTALATLARAAVVDPDDPVLWNNVAVVAWRLGALDTARLAVDEALTLRSDYPEAVGNRRHFSEEVAPRIAKELPGEVRFLKALLERRRRGRPPLVADGGAESRRRERWAEISTPYPITAPPTDEILPVQMVAIPSATALDTRSSSATSVKRGPPSLAVQLSPMTRHASTNEATSEAATAIVDSPQTQGLIPGAILHLSPGSGDLFVVDKQAHRLYHYRGTYDGPRLVAGYPCVLGKRLGPKRRRGDHRTPEGVYFIEKYLDGRELPAMYGPMAYTTDYPNSFDRRAGRTGSGIWLHGTDDPDRLKIPYDSRGCVVMANDDLRELSAAVQVRQTPVLVVPAIEWVSPEVAAARAGEVTAWIEAWRRDWEEGDLSSYRGRYGGDFFVLARTRPSSWLQRKGRYLREERMREIQLQGMSIFQVGDQLVAVFDQIYRSPRHEDRGIKRIYLTAGDDGIEILAEKWLPAG